MGSQVSIVRCNDYSKAKAAITEALELIGGLGSVISSGDRVLLKPNVLATRTADEAVTTHPAIVSAMCGLVVEAGGIPMVGGLCRDYMARDHRGGTRCVRDQGCGQ